MENTFYKLNRLRLIRNTMFLGAFLFCSIIFVVNLIITKQGWIKALIIFDDLLLFVILIFLVESHIGMNYEESYHHEFLPLVFNQLNTEYEYQKHPKNLSLNLKETKIFDYDSHIRINDYVKVIQDKVTYELYHTQVYISTYRSNKIVQYNGYIIVLPKENEVGKGVILYRKKPFLGALKEVKSLNFMKYRIFQVKDSIIDNNLIEDLKDIILKYQDKGLKFYVCMQDDQMIFIPNRISFFHKPILKTINESFLNKKMVEFNNINQIVKEFIDCIHKNKV